MGIDRTLFLVWKVDPGVTRETVQNVVRYCDWCQSIDSAPSMHETGETQMKTNWARLALHVIHYRGILFFWMVNRPEQR